MENQSPVREVLIASSKFPFSDILGYGNLIFVSGAIGRNPENGEIALNDVATQTRQTLLNLKIKLEQVGSSLDKALKVTVFLVDMSHFPKMNEVYRTFFTQGFPARSCIGVASLPDKDALVEVEIIAGR